MSLEFRRILVMAAGLFTTIITMVLYAYIDGLDILRSYVSFIVPIPIGAFGLGVLAGSGYGISGWFLTDLKFTVRMLGGIALSMVVCYGIINYLEFVTYAAEGVGFFEYFDQATRFSSFSHGQEADPLAIDAGEEPDPSTLLGPAGYVYRLLEFAALVFGGIGGCAIVPLFRKA